MDRLDDKNITRFGAAARKLLREATTESDHLIGTMLENAYHNLTKEAQRDAREQKNKQGVVIYFKCVKVYVSSSCRWICLIIKQFLAKGKFR